MDLLESVRFDAIAPLELKGSHVMLPAVRTAPTPPEQVIYPRTQSQAEGIKERAGAHLARSKLGQADPQFLHSREHMGRLEEIGGLAEVSAIVGWHLKATGLQLAAGASCHVRRLRVRQP